MYLEELAKIATSLGCHVAVDLTNDGGFSVKIEGPSYNPIYFKESKNDVMAREFIGFGQLPDAAARDALHSKNKIAVVGTGAEQKEYIIISHIL
jgi:hypothetical protein